MNKITNLSELEARDRVEMIALMLTAQISFAKDRFDTATANVDTAHAIEAQHGFLALKAAEEYLDELGTLEERPVAGSPG
ncbi:MAG: hypothetical protein V2I27_00225 [Erythrobacter sp.]|jgi:hypothetical protein|nr:hypothetical protein [Erythrobacter sp.]